MESKPVSTFYFLYHVSHSLSPPYWANKNHAMPCNFVYNINCLQSAMGLPPLANTDTVGLYSSSGLPPLSLYLRISRIYVVWQKVHACLMHKVKNVVVIHIEPEVRACNNCI